MPTGKQRQDWEDLAVLDPYWAILSETSRRFARADRDSFRESGRGAIDTILRDGAAFGLPLARRDALDFGCGAGRLTRALSPHFARCLGLDISETMIAEASQMAEDSPNCEFIVHDSSNLAMFETNSFDLVVCQIVLQHIPARDAKAGYITEFLRVLRPEGLLALQLPSWIPARHRIQLRPRLYGFLRRAGVSRAMLYQRLHLHPIRMSFMDRASVVRLISAAGGRTLDIRDHTVAGGAVSTDYLVTKNV
jgi:ubiquinone/menaquinone biosynthesis C-methylase UbiE